MINFRIRAERLLSRAQAIRTRAARLRGAWLAGLPIVGLATVRLLWPAAGAGARPWPWILAAGLVFALAWTLAGRRRGGADVLRDLDREMGLGDLLVTAEEVDRRGARSALERRLLEDGAAAIARFGGERALSDRAIRLERDALVGIGLVAFGLVVLGEARRVPPHPDRLPPIEVPAAAGGAGERPGADGAGHGNVGSTGQGGGGMPGTDALARAFGATAAGAEVAAALEQGDGRTAARAVRALADRIDEMSPAGREALGQAMSGAGSSADDELARAARSASDALQGDGERAADGLAELAAALDSLAGRAPRAVATPSIVERPGPGAEVGRLDAAGDSAASRFDTSVGSGVDRSAAGRGQDSTAVQGPGGSGARAGERAGSSAGRDRAARGMAPSAPGSAAGLPPDVRPIVLRYFSAAGRPAP